MLKSEHKLLDTGTGGGEVLLTLNHPSKNTTVTEGYEPNYRLCLKQLKPRGIKVVFHDGEKPLPFQEASFDVVINRHESYDITEVFRVLKPGGFFITQQVGSYNNAPLRQALLLKIPVDATRFSLQQQLPLFKAAGFCLLEQHEAKIYHRYYTIDAVIFMATVLPWEFPGFSVSRCVDGLNNIETILKKRVTSNPPSTGLCWWRENERKLHKKNQRLKALVQSSSCNQRVNHNAKNCHHWNCNQNNHKPRFGVMMGLLTSLQQVLMHVFMFVKISFNISSAIRSHVIPSFHF